MSLEEFKHLADFDFAEHFGIITHTVKLDNSNWKTYEILNDISQGFGSIKCKFCDNNAAIIKTDDKVGYWEDHSEDLELSSKEVAKIERITNDFKERVENMYKYLIFVQERIHFIKLDRFKALIDKKVDDIDGLKDKLDLKINSFHTIIQTLKKSRDCELVFNAKSSFDDIKKIAWDIVNEIYDLLRERFKESFCKSINNDWDVNYLNDYHYKEETKGEKPTHQAEDNIYEKPLDIFIGDFISSLKVFNFKDEIKDLFNC